MNINKFLITILFALLISFVSFNYAKSGIDRLVITNTQTDNSLPEDDWSYSLFYVFDLRDRETFIQFSYEGVIPTPQGDTDDSLIGLAGRTHVQIFDVSNNCNENNFFDVYTVNDTHVYNMRDIQTNDGNPSGVVLSNNSYGIVIISYTTIDGQVSQSQSAFGNLRILDNNGYEYRTNGQQINRLFNLSPTNSFTPTYSINFNTENGVTLSDIFGVTVNLLQFPGRGDELFEWDASNILKAYYPLDIDIYNENEVPFSCRDIIFSCVNEEHPLLEELLAIAETANVASFEYGINNAIPNTMDAELLCPGNVVSEGFVTLNPEVVKITSQDSSNFPFFLGFVGLNNGNGRGSMDSLWNVFINPGPD